MFLEVDSVFVEDDSVVLTCEVYGYATFTEPPTWKDNLGKRITNSFRYGLSLTEGSNTLIYGNGAIGPSIVSTLTIRVPTSGNYSCTLETLVASIAETVTSVIQLNVTTPIVSVTSLVTTSASSQSTTQAQGSKSK